KKRKTFHKGGKKDNHQNVTSAQAPGTQASLFKDSHTKPDLKNFMSKRRESENRKSPGNKKKAKTMSDAGNSKPQQNKTSSTPRKKQPVANVVLPWRTHSDTEPSWERPAPPDLNPDRDALLFQQFEVNYIMGDPVEKLSVVEEGPVPTVRFYGITEKGN